MTPRSWCCAQRLLALLAACLLLASPAQGAGFDKKSGKPPTLATRDLDYYLTGNPADMARSNQPTTQMTVLMGGDAEVDEAFHRMIARAGGTPGNKIDAVVIRASGEDGYNDYLFAMPGVDSVETLVIRSREAANDPMVARIIAGADLLFIAGGDQWNYINLWNETEVEKTIKNVLLSGKVPIGGTSAGLAVLGAVDYSAQYDTVTSAEALANPYHRQLTLDRSFIETVPRLENTIADAHLRARDRMGRLVTFLARMVKDGLSWRVARAIGVDEQTALVIDGGTAIVLTNQDSPGAVYFLKLPQEPGASLVVLPKTPLEVSSVHVDKLTQAAGAAFDMANWMLRGGGTSYQLYVQKGVLYGPGGSAY